MASTGVTPEEIKNALLSNATLNLLKAYSRDWVLPLFAEHLEHVDGSVSAEWFHERVSETLEQHPDWRGDRSPAEHCRKWVEARWLETETESGRLRYRLSPHSLRALRIVREIVEGESSVSGARLGSIAHAVRLLADMTSPDRTVQVRRIDKQIEDLQRRREEIASGRARLANMEEVTAGLLRLGWVLRFVSNSVMVGFISAVGVNMILGQLANFTGYAADGPNRVVRAVDTLLHPGRLHWQFVAVRLVTIALIVVFERARIGALGLVLAIVVTSATVPIPGWTTSQPSTTSPLFRTPCRCRSRPPSTWCTPC